MQVRTIKPIQQTQSNCDCTCGESWGFMGHVHFEAAYVCPHCDHIISIKQCAAWPIKTKGCPHCAGWVRLELNSVKGVLFR